MTINEVSKKYGITQDTLRYYERVGMVPPVTRTPGGIRNYGPEDISWLELALCMRSAGLPVEVMIEYLNLYRQGDSTISRRLQLLRNQREALMAQRSHIDEMLGRLNYKIERYEEAEKTGTINWPKADCPERKAKKAQE